MTKIFQHDIYHWSLEEFIRFIVIETEIPINNEQLRKHILHEIKKNRVTENQYHQPDEIDTCLVEATERIVGVLSNTIEHISLEMSLPIIFWMRIALNLHNQYQINIDSVVENYSNWRNNEGKNLQLVYSPRISKGKSEIIPFDLFLVQTGYKRNPQILKTSEWYLEEIKGIVAKKTKNAKDPYCNIGEPAFIKLKEMMKKAALNIQIKNLLPYHGDGKVKHLFYGKREDLYNILVEKYSLDIAFSSYCQASPKFVNLTRKKLNLSPAQIQIIKLRKIKPLTPLKPIHEL
ncbi:hypothetical protein [Comamonas kerstersii]|uniref:hypothetical protein n=1 Tax=Comamonas kerstersii TaxID=225992 RepID=UPI001B321D2F|nr:hypothetical protein [Comamonas kerstersii]QTW19958.1 hypothetical protein H8N02_05815 [Comamonas kerstersii]